MRAVISGRAGVALLFDKERLRSLHACDLPKVSDWNIANLPFVERRFSDLNYLLPEPIDQETIDVVDELEVAHKLLEHVDRESALDVTLILLDPELSDETRMLAAGELNDFFDLTTVENHLESILFAAPIPKSADLRGAIRICQEFSPALTLTAAFLQDLEEAQPGICHVSRAWAWAVQRIPSVEEQCLIQNWFVRESVFRQFVKANGKDAELKRLLTQITPFAEWHSKPWWNDFFQAFEDQLGYPTRTSTESTAIPRTSTSETAICRNEQPPGIWETLRLWSRDQEQFTKIAKETNLIEREGGNATIATAVSSYNMIDDPVSILTRRILDLSGNRIKGLRIDISSDKVTLYGSCHAYYYKMLAMLTINEVLPGIDIDNLIDVN